MKPDFPSLADETAEPRPDMNIKVAAFTVSEKSFYTSGRALSKVGAYVLDQVTRHEPKK